ncbi:MAG: hypothetical protein ACO1TE_18520 [Prosthecobacter sp.]
MNRPRPKPTLQILAAAVTFAAVMVLLTPLRRGSVDAPSRQAGWMPLLNLGGLADSPSFHRLERSPSRDHASDAPLLRQPSSP